MTKAHAQPFAMLLSDWSSLMTKFKTRFREHISKEEKTCAIPFCTQRSISRPCRVTTPRSSSQPPAFPASRQPLALSRRIRRRRQRPWQERCAKQRPWRERSGSHQRSRSGSSQTRPFKEERWLHLFRVSVNTRFFCPPPPVAGAKSSMTIACVHATRLLDLSAQYAVPSGSGCPGISDPMAQHAVSFFLMTTNTVKQWFSCGRMLLIA